MTADRRRFLGSAVALGLATPPVARALTPRALVLQAAGPYDAGGLGYFVAMDRGFYRDAGLELRILPGGAEDAAEAALLSNRADVALSAVEPVVRAITTRKAPLVIVGAQYQRSPIGVVSLAVRPVRSPKDLVGRALAVPSAHRPAVEAMLRLGGVDASRVRLVPAAPDPAPLMRGEVDAIVDDTTRAPFVIQGRGAQASVFLLADFMPPAFAGTVVVKRETLARRRDDLAGFLRASRRGWDENFRDTGAYPPKLADTWFRGAGRSIDHEVYANGAQQSLIRHPDGVFAMTEASIRACIDALKALDLKAARTHFDATLLARR